MIRITNTKHLLGVTISGDYDDLYELVEAIYQVTVSQYAGQYSSHVSMSTRVLGFCYDCRHAYMGNRDIELIPNHMHEELMKAHMMITPKNNVYYKFNFLYTEMFYLMMALNELIRLRMIGLIKDKYGKNNALDKAVVWDDVITTIRSFQASFTKCLKEFLDEKEFNRYLDLMNEDHCFYMMAIQYADLQTIEYMKLSKEERRAKLMTYARRLAKFHNSKKHIEMKQDLKEAAKYYGCAESDLKAKGIEYPEEELEW
jgi:hypothetical protein